MKKYDKICTRINHKDITLRKIVRKNKASYLPVWFKYHYYPRTTLYSYFMDAIKYKSNEVVKYFINVIKIKDAVNYDKQFLLEMVDIHKNYDIKELL